MKTPLVLVGGLLLLAAMPCLAAHGSRSLLHETFETASPTAPPTGWLVSNPGGDAARWETRAVGGVPWGVHCARFRVGPVQPADDWLISSSVWLQTGVPCTVRYRIRASNPPGPLSLEILAGPAQSPVGMVHVVTPLHPVGFTDYVEETGSFVPTASGAYFLGVHVVGPPGAGRLDLDDLDASVPETMLRLSLGMSRELDQLPLVFGANDTLEACVAIENTGPGSPVINQRLAIGRWPSTAELDFEIVGPTGRLPVLNLFEKLGALRSSHFAALAPLQLSGKTVNLWSWYPIDSPGTYVVEARYRNYSDPAGLGAWKGELVSDPVTIIIQ